MTAARYDSAAATPEGSGLPPQRQVSDRLCGCGCGQHTLIAYRTRGRDGARRGEPLRFLNGHTSRHGTSLATGRPCDRATLLVCAACDGPMHSAAHDQRTCAAGHPSLVGRRLCTCCYARADRTGTLLDYPRQLRSRDELLDEWEWLRGDVTFRAFAGQMGMTYEAWERAFLRAKAAGDTRAVRANEKERLAA